jgi:hypothetical protein
MTARRRGGVPPIVTVLITISAVVAAGLVAYFLFSTTSSATKQPMLEVTGAYAICATSGSTTSCAVYITLRNVGASDVTISTSPPPQIDVLVGTSTTSITCALNPAPPNNQVPSGGSVNLRCPSSGTQSVNIPDGASATLLLTVQPTGGGQQSLSLAFKIARP